jgi:hypothetical protein
MWTLVGWAVAAEPELVVRRVERTAVSPNTMTTSTGQVFYFGATELTFVKFWAEDRAGSRVLAEDFALRVDRPELAQDIRARLGARRALATPLMIAGAGGWAAGAALLLAAQASDGDPSAGALALVGGQVAAVTGLVLSATNRNRKRRLDPWLEWNEVVELVPPEALR